VICSSSVVHAELPVVLVVDAVVTGDVVGGCDDVAEETVVVVTPAAPVVVVRAALWLVVPQAAQMTATLANAARRRVLRRNRRQPTEVWGEREVRATGRTIGPPSLRFGPLAASPRLRNEVCLWQKINVG
jgi:hypothetical protein